MAMPDIEVLRVAALETMHARAEIRGSRLYQEVDVVAHQAVGETVPPHPAGHAGEGRDVTRTVPVVDVDRLLAIAAGGDVVDADFTLGARSARHDRSSRGSPDLAPVENKGDCPL